MSLWDSYTLYRRRRQNEIRNLVESNTPSRWSRPISKRTQAVRVYHALNERGAKVWRSDGRRLFIKVHTVVDYSEGGIFIRVFAGLHDYQGNRTSEKGSRIPEGADQGTRCEGDAD